MCKRWRACLLSSLLCVIASQAYALQGRAIVPLPASDGLIVKFATNASRTSQSHALNAAGLRAVESFQLVEGLSHVRPVAGQTIATSTNTLLNNPAVEYVEPNYLVSIDVIPNDPELNMQYGLHNTGQTGGLTNADINAPEAWDISTGSDVLIAVIDTGVDYRHPDLSANIWTNSGELAGNGVDDDNNGYVDDVRGYDFANNDPDPMDDHGHGTHVAGIIAAVGNNGTGVSGVNWKARIIPLKFIDSSGIGSTVNAIRAINYAVAKGARISNNSWGGGGFSQALYDTIAAAQNAGHMFVAAAGNDGLNSDDPANAPHYPSSYDLNNIISVAATDHSDNIASFSNYGSRSVDLGAPGVRVYSTLPGNLYQSLDGTSMASPFVAGVAGLVLSKMPNISTDMLRTALLNGVDRVAPLSGITVTGGRINAQKALSNVNADLRITPNTASIAVNQSIQFTVTGGTPPYSWSTSNTNVGSISSVSGSFTGLNAGSTDVSVVDANGFTAKSGLIRVEQLTITPNAADLTVGQTMQFSVSGGVSPYRWRSGNTLIGNIDSVSGLFTARGVGLTEVFAVDANGIEAKSGDVRVLGVPSLSLSPLSGNLSPGSTLTFTVSGGAPPYSWSLSDPTIASINTQTGVLTAIDTGVTTVTVTDSAGSSVRTNPINISGLLINANVTTITVNDTLNLSVSGGTPPYQWRVSNSSIATVSSEGVLTALTPGSVKVTIMDAQGLIGRSETILVNESSVLTLFPTDTIIGVGKTTSVKVSGGTAPYNWNASNPSVLAIDKQSGTISGVGKGFGTVSLTDATGAKATSVMLEVRELRITPTVNALNVGDSLALSASGGASPYQWSVSALNIASVDSGGVVKALAAGAFNVTATDADGISVKTKTITVNSLNGAGQTHVLEIRPSTALLSRRSSNVLQFVATGGLPPYTFTSTNPNIGSMNRQTGEFMPLSSAAGSTTVIVTDADGHVMESGVISVQ